MFLINLDIIILWFFKYIPQHKAYGLSKKMANQYCLRKNTEEKYLKIALICLVFPLFLSMLNRLVFKIQKI